MIDPKGTEPDAEWHRDSNDSDFGQPGSSADQPMYATDPAAPAVDQPSAGTGPGSDDTRWELPGTGGQGQPEQHTEAELKSLLAAAEAKTREVQEQYLRALAEMENVRRRAQEDVSKAHKFAIESFAEGLLPVRDSLEMALIVDAPTVESMKEGVEATLRQLTQAFDRNRLVVIDPLRQKFDPNLHQAISMAPSRDLAPNHVMSVLQKGYMINDRILRPALVVVSQPG